MSDTRKAGSLAVRIDKNSYTITTLEDEVRVDQQCSALLKSFHRSLLEEQKLEPLEAGSLAAGADYFLRDFVIDNQRRNIFDVTAGSIRTFAGHWYITSNLEPNLAELTAMLKGAESFYNYCAHNGLIADETAGEIRVACNDFSYYAKRIETFLELTGDGFIAWEKDAPLA